MVLVFFVSIALFILLFSLGGRQGAREAAVKSYISIFFLIAVFTNIFSCFHIITHRVILSFWVFVVVFLLFIVLVALRSREIDSFFPAGTLLKSFRDDGWSALCPALILAVVMIVTLLVALLSPPNNWDSMTYHMARVAEWIEHQNIDFYPTVISRQNYQMPMAEFVILHLQLLTESDRFANIVQWMSFGVSVTLASLVAKELGAAFRTQLMSAVITATIPMAILQASSTQNDLVTSALCLSFVYFLLKFAGNQHCDDFVFSSLSLGLALLTKGTAFLYCAGIGVTLAVAYILNRKINQTRLKRIGILALVAFLGILITIPHLSKNYGVYGSFFTGGGYFSNKGGCVSGLFANIVRNGALHLGTPSAKT